MFSNRETDVFVAGGGPAGLAVAIAARRKGFSVTLADGAAPPIDKPCGEGMMPETQAALRELGVTLPPNEGQYFRGIRFVVGATRVAANFPQGRGVGLRRPVLHELLLAEAERLQVQFRWRTPIRGIGSNEVHLASGTVKTRWIVGADGGASRVRKWSGLGAGVRTAQRSASRRHYRMLPWSDYMEIHWGPRSQAYVTPISNEEVCIVMMAEENADADFERALYDLPVLRKRLASAELTGRERGAITSMCSLRCVSRGHVALVGDASGGVDAITGEGLRLAFRQAYELAEAMERNDLARYERAHKRLARRPMWMGKLLLQFGKRPWIKDRSMRVMQSRPELFEKLLAIHVGRSTPGNVIAAGARFSWQFLTA